MNLKDILRFGEKGDDDNKGKKVIRTYPIKKEWLEKYNQMKDKRKELESKTTAAIAELYDIHCVAMHYEKVFWVMVENDTGEHGNMTADTKTNTVKLYGNPFREVDALRKLAEIADEDDEE